MYRYCATFCARPASRRGTPRAPACTFCLPAPSHARAAGGLTEALSNIGNCCGPVPCLLLKSNVEEKVEAQRRVSLLVTAAYIAGQYVIWFAFLKAASN